MEVAKLGTVNIPVPRAGTKVRQVRHPGYKIEAACSGLCDPLPRAHTVSTVPGVQDNVRGQEEF